MSAAHHRVLLDTSVVIDYPAFDLIPFDAGAARIYGALGANVSAIGRDPKPRRFDMLIAAVAVALGIPLITRNENDFRGIHSALSIIAV